MTAHGRNVVAQHALHSLIKSFNVLLQITTCIKCAPAPATPPDWPPQRAWLRVPEVWWGDLRPPVFPASLEQLRASKLAKLPQVHKRLPPTRAAA